MSRLRVAAAQLNLVVGDLDGNVERILDAYDARRGRRLRPGRLPRAGDHRLPARGPAAAAGVRRRRRRRRSRRSPPAPAGCAAVVGFPEAGRDLYNAAAVCADGTVQGVYRKHLLPNYARVRRAALLRASSVDGPLFVVGGVRVGVIDLRGRVEPDRPDRRPRPPAAPSWSSTSTRRRTTPGASPSARRCSPTRAADASVPIALREPRRRPGRARLRRRVDGLRRDGPARRPGPAVRRGPARRRPRRPPGVPQAPPRSPGPGRPPAAARGRRSRERRARRPRRRDPARVEPLLDPVHEVYEALVLGTRDYVRKNGFTDVVIGLSGGIDSSLVAAIAADALGPEHVTGVLMPSRYSSDGSVTDAEALAANLGIRTVTIPIEAAHAAFLDAPGRAVRGHGARPRRGEPPGPHPRHAPHERSRTSSAGWC